LPNEVASQLKTLNDIVNHFNSDGASSPSSSS